MYELDCCFENVDVIRIGGFMNIFVLIIYDGPPVEIIDSFFVGSRGCYLYRWIYEYFCSDHIR
jgi:hypothetical protein